MVEHPIGVVMADHRRELVQNRERDFPYIAMEGELHNYPGGATPWHLHDHFEITVLCCGRMEICTQQGAVSLAPGQGCFVNANVLHITRMIEASDYACFHTQQFTGDLISGSGLVARRYVSTVESCVAFEALRLDPEDACQREILQAFARAFAAAEEDAPGYEMFVSAHLTEAWGGLYRLIEPLIDRAQGQQRENAARVKAMINFIYDHYQSPISVRQIADAAGICERECFRCFSEILNTTPMQYLNRHRVGMAARALAEGGASIAQIAEACGFAGSSYFGKVFHREMGCSPLEFRRKNS